MRDSKCTTKDGIVNIHLTKDTLWAAYINENYFDPYGWPPNKLLTEFINKLNTKCVFS